MNAPSTLGQKMHVYNTLVRTAGVKGNTNWCGSPNQLTLPTKPLSLGDEWYAVAFLMDSQVTAVTEHDGICVFTVSIVAYRTLAVLLLAHCTGGLTIDRSS